MAGLSNVVLAARLGCHEGEVRRLLDPRHASRLERLADAIGAAGGDLELRLHAPPKVRLSAWRGRISPNTLVGVDLGGLVSRPRHFVP